jgi:hypothetical protein
MQCPEDKFAVYCAYLRVWAVPDLKELSLDAVRKACGLMNFIAEGWPIGRADVASIIHMRTAGEAIAFRRPRLAPTAVMVKISPAAHESFDFWLSRFLVWDRKLRVHHDFGPSHSWEVRGAVDASTDWGWGGLLVSSAEVGAPIWFRNGLWTQSQRTEAFVVERESTGAFELMGAFLWMSTFGKACQHKRLLLEIDNRESARALAAGYSKCPRIMPYIRKIRVLCAELCIHLRVHHVLGVPFNAIADLLSHDRHDDAIETCRDTLEVVMQPWPSTL